MKCLRTSHVADSTIKENEFNSKATENHIVQCVSFKRWIFVNVCHANQFMLNYYIIIWLHGHSIDVDLTWNVYEILMTTAKHWFKPPSILHYCKSFFSRWNDFFRVTSSKCFPVEHIIAMRYQWACISNHRFSCDLYFRTTLYTLTWHRIHPNASHPNVDSAAGSYVRSSFTTLIFLLAALRPHA